MARWFKFVALVLMLVMGTLPLLASASPSCRMMASSAQPEPAKHHCCPSMAMRAGTASHALETDNTMPCCRVAPPKPLRAVELQIPPTASAELALEPANEAVNAATIATHTRTTYSPPLPDSARSQSHLCTFLI